ncbi:MAG: DapH/DapD/GlmU-related protein [Acidobacteriota bacterium]
MFDNLRHDLRRIAEFKQNRPTPSLKLVLDSLLFDNGFQIVALHRLAYFFKKSGIPVIGPLVGRVSQLVTGAEIAPAAEIGPGLMIGHGRGLVIGQWAKVGANCTVMHQVTLGATSLSTLGGMPQVGDDVFIGAGARIVGPVTVGDGALVGTGALVTRDVPAGGKALGAVAEIRGPKAPRASEGQN